MTTYTRNTLSGSLAPVNSELEKIEVSLREKLDRNPSVAQNNEMLDDLDMNSKRIFNLAKPTDPNDAVRLQDLEEVEGFLDFLGIVEGKLDYVDTTSNLINSSNVFPVGKVILTLGYLSEGDGGGAQWKLTAINGAPSQSPSQLASAFLNDSDGNQWSLVDNSFNDIKDALNVPESTAKAILNTTDYAESFFKKSTYNNDTTIPSATSNTLFIRDVASVSGQATTAQIQRFANVTTSSNPKAFRCLTTIGEGVSSTEYAISGELENNSELNSAGATALSGTALKNNKGNTFASHFQVKDTQGDPSSIGGAIVGQEINIQANDVDDEKVRIGYDIIARTYEPNFATNGEGEFWAGVRIRNSLLGAEGGKWVNALLIQDGVSAIERGVTIENSPTTSFGYGLSDTGDKAHGIRLLGNYGQAALDVRPDGVASANFFGGNNTIGQESAALTLGARNSNADRTSYSRIRNVIQGDTATAEVGRLDLDFKAAGTLTTGIQLSGNSAVNPVFLRINGALKQVTQGASDSGGVGFRALIVPN